MDEVRPWLCCTPGCEFRVHSDPKFGGWCCRACAKLCSDMGGDCDLLWSEEWDVWQQAHGPRCEGRVAPDHFDCNYKLPYPEESAVAKALLTVNSIGCELCANACLSVCVCAVVGDNDIFKQQRKAAEVRRLLKNGKK